MQILPSQAATLNRWLRGTIPYLELPATNRPVEDLWAAMDACHLALRMPLYHKRLGKRQPKPAVVEDAVQKGLALVGAFALLFEVNQAIVSSKAGYIDRISFQPRPSGMNWTAHHAISPNDLVHRHPIPYEVSFEDFLHLAGKLVYAIAGRNAGELSEVTATFDFGGRGVNALLVTAVVHNHIDGSREYAVLHPGPGFGL